MYLLVVLAVISTALVAGIFFVFSTFVMHALNRLQPREAIAAMQSINVAVLNRWFFGAFFGAGVFSAIALAFILLEAPETGRVAAGTGCLLYVFGCIGVTALGNVPLNEQLDKVGPEVKNPDVVWGEYVEPWMRWNHVRTFCSLAASVAFALCTS